MSILNSNILTLCPQCNNYPLLSLKPKDILIQYDHCKYNQYTSLHNYLYHINTISPIKTNDKKCNTHNQIYNKYCIQCKLYLCNQCTTHESHKLISLDNIISTTDITNKVNEGYNHINIYCNELKKDKINHYINKINQLEYTYQSFLTVNNDILDIIMIMINSYNNNRYNYYTRENIINIINYKEIKIYKCNNTKELINYYNNYNILRDHIVDINNIINIKTINERSKFVTSLLLLSDGRLASCSRDKTIKIYDIKNNYHCDITLEGHTDCVTYISQLYNNILISCSSHTIKIWSITQSSYQCDYTINNAHNDYIWKVIPLTNNRIASCSGDKTIKIWNSNHPYNLINTLNGHTDDVRSIIQLKDKDILISESDDNTLRKWNLLTYQCDKIINNVWCYKNSLLEIDNNRIIVGGIGIITIVNISNDIIEHQIENDKLSYVYSFVQLRDGNILCGCENGLICLYDIKLNTLSFREKEIHYSEVYCLLNLNKYQFISCSFEIKVWEY